MSKKVPLTEPVKPADDAAPAVKDKYRRDKEAFFAEGFKPVVKVEPEDTVVAATTLSRLKALGKAHDRFLDLASPMKASIWLALLRPAKDILFDAEMSRRFREQQRSPDAKGEAIAPSMPAIVALGIEMVASALSGDSTAQRAIADRIEGTPGLRQGDTDPDDPKRQKQTREIVERVTRAMNQKRLESHKEEDAKDITDVVDISTEGEET